MLPADVLVHVVRQVEEPLDRWQTAATLARAGAFGREWKEHVRGLWAEDATAMGRSAQTGPYRTVEDLKVAAQLAGFVTRGLKKADLLQLMPQHVPPCLVAAAREALRDRRVARDVDAYLDTDANEGERITATDAKRTYCLTEEDLEGLVYEPRRNPHYRSGPPMRLYEVREVVVAAYEKHGGQAGLAAVQAASRDRREARVARQEAREEAARQARRQALARAGVPTTHPIAIEFILDGDDAVERVAARVQRDQALRVALAERGLALREDSRLCYAYVHRGWGSIPEIVDTMDEMRFYHTHTSYAVYRQEIYRKHRHLGTREISERAKAKAWRSLLKHRRREWLLEHLPPSLRQKLENGAPAEKA